MNFEPTTGYKKTILRYLHIHIITTHYNIAEKSCRQRGKREGDVLPSLTNESCISANGKPSLYLVSNQSRNKRLYSPTVLSNKRR